MMQEAVIPHSKPGVTADDKEIAECSIRPDGSFESFRVSELRWSFGFR